MAQSPGLELEAWKLRYVRGPHTDVCRNLSAERIAKPPYNVSALVLFSVFRTETYVLIKNRRADVTVLVLKKLWMCLNKENN